MLTFRGLKFLSRLATLEIHCETFTNYFSVQTSVGCRSRDIPFCHQIIERSLVLDAGISRHIRNANTIYKIVRGRNMLRTNNIVIPNAINVTNLATLEVTVPDPGTIRATLMQSPKSTPINLNRFCLRHASSQLVRQLKLTTNEDQSLVKVQTPKMTPMKRYICRKISITYTTKVLSTRRIFK